MDFKSDEEKIKGLNGKEGEVQFGLRETLATRFGKNFTQEVRFLLSYSS